MIYIPFQPFFNNQLMPIANLPDDTLSKGLLGDGFFVLCEETHLKSPIEGTIRMIYPTKHYILIESHGHMVMLHFGLGQQLNTISWHFEVGQTIQIGDLIATLTNDFYSKDATQHLLSIIVMETTHCELIDHLLTCIKKAT